MPPSGLAASTIPFDSMPISFAGLQVGDDDDRPADELLGLIRLGDAGDDRPLLGADIDLQLHQLLRLRHGLGLEHLGHAQLDLHEVVDRDARSSAAGVPPRRCRCRCRRGSAASPASALRPSVPEWTRWLSSSRAVPRRSFQCAETAVRSAPSRVPGASVPACSAVHGSLRRRRAFRECARPRPA